MGCKKRAADSIDMNKQFIFGPRLRTKVTLKHLSTYSATRYAGKRIGNLHHLFYLHSQYPIYHKLMATF